MTDDRRPTADRGLWMTDSGRRTTDHRQQMMDGAPHTCARHLGERIGGRTLADRRAAGTAHHVFFVGVWGQELAPSGGVGASAPTKARYHTPQKAQMAHERMIEGRTYPTPGVSGARAPTKTRYHTPQKAHEQTTDDRWQKLPHGGGRGDVRDRPMKIRPYPSAASAPSFNGR